MKLHKDITITINGKLYPAGTEVSWLTIYPFFLLHMGIFGLSGFFLAYAADDAPMLFRLAHGGIAVGVYLVFYLAIFGADEVKWMFTNSLLGLFGIYSQLGWMLSLFGKEIGDYPMYLHFIPMLYYVLYTFLIRQALIDITQSRDDPGRRHIVETIYVAGSLLVYVIAWFIHSR